MSETQNSELLPLVASIVSAHLSNNALPAGDLPALIMSVHAALTGLGPAPVAVEELRPAVAIRKSVYPDYIVCLEDGKKLKMLKRHLATSYDMTPGQYRERWNLPADYPMVAPSYAEKRSMLAKSIGLGRKAKEVVETAEVSPQPATRTARRSKKIS